MPTPPEVPRPKYAITLRRSIETRAEQFVVGENSPAEVYCRKHLRPPLEPWDVLDWRRVQRSIEYALRPGNEKYAEAAADPTHFRFWLSALKKIWIREALREHAANNRLDMQSLESLVPPAADSAEDAYFRDQPERDLPDRDVPERDVRERVREYLAAHDVVVDEPVLDEALEIVLLILGRRPQRELRHPLGHHRDQWPWYQVIEQRPENAGLCHPDDQRERKRLHTQKRRLQKKLWPLALERFRDQNEPQGDDSGPAGPAPTP